MQNSPSFTWPIIYDATYELVLANDKELTDIAYEVKDIPVNVYTFSHTLEAGKDYYWAVRYKLKGKYSKQAILSKISYKLNYNGFSEFVIQDIIDELQYLNYQFVQRGEKIKHEKSVSINIEKATKQEYLEAIESLLLENDISSKHILRFLSLLSKNKERLDELLEQIYEQANLKK
jgi:hypothetical protein